MLPPHSPPKCCSSAIALFKYMKLLGMTYDLLAIYCYKSFTLKYYTLLVILQLSIAGKAIFMNSMRHGL